MRERPLRESGHRCRWVFGIVQSLAHERPEITKRRVLTIHALSIDGSGRRDEFVILVFDPHVEQHLLRRASAIAAPQRRNLGLPWSFLNAGAATDLQRIQRPLPRICNGYAGESPRTRAKRSTLTPSFSGVFARVRWTSQNTNQSGRLDHNWARWDCGRGRSAPRHVGGSWAERQESAIDRSPVAPGHITPRSQPQSQILRSQDAPSPSQHPTSISIGETGFEPATARPPAPEGSSTSQGLRGLGRAGPETGGLAAPRGPRGPKDRLAVRRRVRCPSLSQFGRSRSCSASGQDIPRDPRPRLRPRVAQRALAAA